MVVKKHNTSEKEESKARVKVGKLKLNKETVKDLTSHQKSKIKGGLIRRDGNDTKLLGTCTIVQACI